MDIERLKADRFFFLKTLWEASGGDIMAWFNIDDIGKELGFSEDYTMKIFNYLSSEGLIEPHALGGIIGITHYGIKEIEKALSRPENPTKYFPPVNIINIGSMVNSQIQQGGPESDLSMVIDYAGLLKIKEVLNEIKVSLSELQLDSDTSEELLADISSAIAQIKSSKPKFSIITECLKSIRSILESSAGGVLATGLLSKIGPYIPS